MIVSTLEVYQGYPGGERRVAKWLKGQKRADASTPTLATCVLKGPLEFTNRLGFRVEGLARCRKCNAIYREYLK